VARRAVTNRSVTDHAVTSRAATDPAVTSRSATGGEVAAPPATGRAVAKPAVAARRGDGSGASRTAAGSGRRDEVLRLLRGSANPLSIAEVARHVDVHPNTARFHLAALVRSGQAKLVTATHARPGRPAQLFRAVPVMDPSGPRHFRLLAEILADTLADEPDARARAIAAGREWGRRLSPIEAEPVDAPGPVAAVDEDRIEGDVAALVAVLDELGFAPERRPRAAQIGLRSCPFLEVARQRADVVCPIHLGLMQGALAARDAAVTVEELEAFVEPDLCVAHLTVAEEAR
jgi:predicted ArsR family transcriptional regulator